MVLTVQVVASLGRPIVPWSIIEANDEDLSFQRLFEEVGGGCFQVVNVNEELKNCKLLKTYVGPKRDELMVISTSQLVCRVCRQFGIFVKFTTEQEPESQQHVKNVNLLVQCEECNKWRVLFCCNKLNFFQLTELEKLLDDIAYTCGVLFSEFDFPGRLNNVMMKSHS